MATRVRLERQNIPRVHSRKTKSAPSMAALGLDLMFPDPCVLHSKVIDDAVYLENGDHD